jgi:glycosyltransferase involved in cell wall biosynthesis
VTAEPHATKIQHSSGKPDEWVVKSVTSQAGTMKKRVCHLSSVHVATDTRIFYRYCRHLSENYTVTLIAVHPKEEILQGIHIVPFRRFKNKLLRVFLTWFLMFFKAIRNRSDLYHLHDPELIPCGLLLRLMGKKVVLDIHENVAEDIFDKPWIPAKNVLYACFHFFEKVAVKTMPIILAERSYEARYKKLGADYTTVLNYVDLPFFKSFSANVNRKSNRIFYMGILLESRGLQQIAEALYILKKQGHIIEFDVVGELYSSLEKQLHALPFWDDVSPQIHFHGRLTLEQGYEISREAAVGICIIQPMKNSVASYPTKMFEYMAIGLPQVTSDFPLYKTIVEGDGSGICVNPSDPIAIAHAILEILQNPERAESMRQNGLLAVHKYPWDEEMKKVFDLYSRLLW